MTADSLEKKFLSVKQTADQLGVWPQRVYQMIEEEKLSAQKVGRTTLVHRKSLEQYLKTHGRRREKK